jgi:hypothetical protein
VKFDFSGELFKVQIEEKKLSLGITSPLWPALQLDPLTCEIRVNDNNCSPERVDIKEASTKEILNITWVFSKPAIHLIQNFIFSPEGWLHLHSELNNLSEKSLTLNCVSLLKLKRSKKQMFGTEQEKSKVYEDGGYWGQVRPLIEASGISQTCWEIYNPIDHMALLVGYMTFERWLGTVKVSYNSTMGVTEWVTGFDGGDLLIDSNQTLPLEDVIFMIGQDPWCLLEKFGDLIKEKHHLKPLEKPPVSWCSWYPYRLSISEEKVLANAKVATHRLKSLGLSCIQVDYGWEKEYLPSSYEENEQFPHGLKWLSKELTKFGFNLGIWVAPFIISEFDPITHEHPEWLLGSNEEKPKPNSTWFWKPHGKVYAFDLTHPEAQEYLREKIRTLALKGVKYYKLDFTGVPCSPPLRNRHNPRIVAGGGTEAVRIGYKIITKAIRTIEPRCIVLSCNPYEVCGVGYSDMLYTCKDSGNTGYLPWSFMKENYTSVACHLWKNHRLGLIEPSCLCVGLPGTIEEARIRATATFLSGGEVVVSDDLTTLPEDRWQVLLSILPPLNKSAKPLDLFEPLVVEQLSYNDMSSSGLEKPIECSEQEGSSVWYIPIETTWDKWILVGLFAWEPSMSKPGKQETPITRFKLEWERLGLNPNKRYWVYEFWSGQFLGEVPGFYEAPKSYVHPGDARTLLWSARQGILQVAFFGPSVKLLVVREVRPHPWIVGTSFHASGGLELQNVKWNEKKQELSGKLLRPPSEEGFVLIAGLNGKSTQATVANHSSSILPGANGSVKVPIAARREVTYFTIKIT